MKKFILPTLFLFILLFFSSPEANAQTREECDKIRARASYNCLTEWTKCYYPCIDQTKDVKACGDTCTQAQNACDKQVDADYKACLEVRPSSLEKEKQENQSEASEAKKETPQFIEVNESRPGIVSVTFFDFQEIRQLNTSIDQDIPPDMQEFLEELEKFKPMTDEEFQRIWNLRPRDISGGEDKIVDIESGQGQKKGYWWDKDGGAVMNSPSWENIKFIEPVKDNKTQEVLRMVEVDQGQLEVKLKEPSQQNKFGVQGDFFDLFVIQTHFWVSTNQDKKSAMIVVYEGEVEVKTRDGSTIKVKPDGDKPGVVVVSRKLSPVKLGLAGLLIAAIIGGVVFLLKKKRG